MDFSEEYVMKTLGKILCRTVKSYMKDPKHRAEFEAWYLETHGVEWKDRPSPPPATEPVAV